MFGLGAGELLIILVFALVFIGPKKLPELARGLGKGLREFQKAKDDLMNHVHNPDYVQQDSKQQVSSSSGSTGPKEATKTTEPKEAKEPKDQGQAQ